MNGGQMKQKAARRSSVFGAGRYGKVRAVLPTLLLRLGNVQSKGILIETI
jgi:hypothetical protein